MKIILLDETKRMVPLLTANSPWFGRKNGSKLDNHFLVSQFRAVFRPNYGELAIKKDTILFVSSRSMIFVFESLDFVDYWRSYERLKFTQFPASFPVFLRTSHIWGYFPAISGNHWASK